jgi:riboflavin kinase/FMN adenylyltransferase
MNVHYFSQSIPSFKNAVVTIGSFDGVHVGHQKILQQLKARAKEIEGETVVITFHPHPRNIVGDTSGVKLLTTLHEKIALLAAQQIDHLLIVNFNESFAALTAEEYVKEFLYTQIKPHTLIIGYDHRFGKNRTGNFQLLQSMSVDLNFTVEEIDEQVIAQATISSTRIRKALLHADIATAKQLLGYDYFFEGTVIKGDQLGRTIGYPTANLQINDEQKLVPGDGVYAVTVKLLPKQEKLLQGMMYIGSRPVVNGKRRVIEVNLFDFEEDIYGEILQVTLKQFIRADMHFNGLEALQQQLQIDKINTLKALAVF